MNASGGGQMVRFWPDYETYRARTDRQIPIVKLVVEAVSLREKRELQIRGEGSIGVAARLL